MLTNKIIDGAKSKDKPYKLADSHGLYIVIMPTGTKSWRCNYKSAGKNKTHTFGRYPHITLAEARRLNLEFKYSDEATQTTPTFDEIKREWYLHKLPSLKNTKHRQQVIYRLDTFASPAIGKMQLDQIKRADLVKIVQSVQSRNVKGHATVETAHRVAMHMRQVFDYAVDLGKVESHPASGLSRVLKAPKVKHMTCIPVNEAKDLIRAIYNYEEPIPRAGLILALLTFLRTTELRLLEWRDIKDGKFFLIPESRMKMAKPHVVPLSPQVLEVLEAIKNTTCEYRYILNSEVKPNAPICENTLLFSLYRMGYKGKMTVHGFRSLASTVLNERSPFSHDVIERQLAHKESDQVRAAYNRADYLDERIKMMAWWGDWVTSHLG